MSTQSGKLAINGGAPVRSEAPSSLKWPVFGDAERTVINEVLESGQWWFGERVGRFEREYAAFQDAKYCVTCTNGTAAIEIVLRALGIGPGDEVIVPPFTFIATASAVAYVGATPVFVDVDESWCMDPNKIEAAITPRTKAIMPVHFGGRVVDMDRIQSIADAHGLRLIEDACHSWGGKWKGKGTGAIGDCGVFSFQVSKNITAGEGGAILTDDAAIADRCRSITNCGRAKDSQWYEHAYLGTNARLTEFAAALLSAQLTRLEEQTLLREKNAAAVAEALGDVEGITVQPGDERITRRAYHLFCMRFEAAAFGCSRERFIEASQAEGLTVSAGYGMPLYRQPVFAQWPGELYKDCHCPVAEDLCYNSSLWLVHQTLLGSDSDIQDIATTIKKIKENVAELADL